MVNQDNKEIIHNTLENSAGWISGETLSDITGISRVGVWKHLQAMKELGYPLESGRRGYRLAEDEDTLLPWVFGEASRRIISYTVLDSTMNPARELAAQGEEDGTVILAERQTGGMGRLNKDWHSPEGGLYFTLILRPPGPVSRAGLYTLAAAASLRRLLQEEYKVDCRCKWPNDLITPRGKIAGILTEVCGTIESMNHLNLGIGINIWNSSNPLPGKKRTTLKEETGRRIRRREVLLRFLRRFDRLYRSGAEVILEEWAQGFPYRQGPGPFFYKGKEFEGSLKEVFPDGSLTMNTSGGELRFYPGDPVGFPGFWKVRRD